MSVELRMYQPHDLRFEVEIETRTNLLACVGDELKVSFLNHEMGLCVYGVRHQSYSEWFTYSAVATKIVSMEVSEI